MKLLQPQEVLGERRGETAEKFGAMIFFLPLQTSEVNETLHSVAACFPIGKIKETKWLTVSHFVSMQTAAFMQIFLNIFKFIF